MIHLSAYDVRTYRVRRSQSYSLLNDRNPFDPNYCLTIASYEIDVLLELC